jgi:hypothetical protein
MREAAIRKTTGVSRSTSAQHRAQLSENITEMIASSSKHGILDN